MLRAPDPLGPRSARRYIPFSRAHIGYALDALASNES